MLAILIWNFFYSIASALSIVLLGQRDLISGNILESRNLIALLLNWKFIVSMVFALIARFIFIIINNSILKVPRLAESSTTITTVITLFSLIIIIIANMVFLKEKINPAQGIGAVFILAGMLLVLR